MDRLLILIESKSNRERIRKSLHDRYEIVSPPGEATLKEPIDLCILDRQALNRISSRFEDFRKDSRPAFLPFLLVTTHEETNLLPQELWQIVDDVIETPIRVMELQARVEVLLRSRRLSLEVQCLKEARLKSLETHLRLIVETSNIGLWDWNLTTNRVCYSSGWKRQIGYEPHEISDDFSEWQNRVHPEDLDRAVKTVQRYIANPWPDFREEFRFRHRDGSYRWILAPASLQSDSEGKPVRILGCHVDITERKQAEEHMGKFNRLYTMLSNIKRAIVRIREPQKLFEESCRIAVEDGGFRMAWVALKDEGTDRVIISARAGVDDGYLDQLFIATAEGPPGRGPTATVMREGRPIIINDIETDPHGTPPWRDEACKRGCRASAAFPLTVSGKFRGALSLYAGEAGSFDEEATKLLDELAMDLALALEFAEQEVERRKTELLLKESESRYRSLFENNHACMLVIDPESGAIVDANPAASAYYGWTREELRTKKMGDINTMPPEALQEEMNRARLELRRHFLFQHRLADGSERDVEVFSGPISIEGRWLLYSMVYDITDRKRAEEEREKLQAQFLQAQKMEAVGRLAGGVAHDFNNMLGVIIGRSDFVLSRMSPDAQFRHDLQEIHKAGNRSADLTRQLLAFARKQTANPRILDLNDTVAGMLKMLRRLIGEDIDLAWMPGHELWSVKVDPTQIDQMLANLAVNARDAVVGVGRISIETTNVAIDDSYCTDHAGFTPGEYVLLAVSDTGTGMDKDTLEHVFEPFFTTKEVGKGTGLGLATVYGIVKQNQGLVNVYSEPGRGTTFRIYLPRYRAETDQASSDTTEEKLRGGTETVLIVEDEKAILNLAKEILQQLGYTVLTADTPGQAIRLAAKYVGDIHLLITDVVMPEMNGQELAERLSRMKPNLKFLFMSGYTADVIAHHGVLDEGVLFIQKPFSLKALAKKTREALGDQAP